MYIHIFAQRRQVIVYFRQSSHINTHATSPRQSHKSQSHSARPLLYTLHDDDDERRTGVLARSRESIKIFYKLFYVMLLYQYKIAYSIQHSPPPHHHHQRDRHHTIIIGALLAVCKVYLYVCTQCIWGKSHGTVLSRRLYGQVSINIKLERAREIEKVRLECNHSRF